MKLSIILLFIVLYIWSCLVWFTFGFVGIEVSFYFVRFCFGFLYLDYSLFIVLYCIVMHCIVLYIWFGVV